MSSPAIVRREPLAVFIGTAFLVLLGSRHATSQVKGVPSPSDSIAQLNQRIDALTQRVKQLELGQANFQKSLSKPDAPDDAGESTKKALTEAGGSSGKGTSSEKSSGGSAAAPTGGNASDPAKDPPYPSSQATNLLSITQRLTALENRHGMTAPFNVTDASGKLIFRVEDSGNGGGRGAYVFNSQGHLVVAAYDSSGLGGHVDVMSGSDSSMRARLSGSSGQPSMELVEGQSLLAELVATSPNEIELNLNPNGGAGSGLHAGGDQSALFLRGSATETSLVNSANAVALTLGPKSDPTIVLNADTTGGSIRTGKGGAAGSTYTRMAANQDGLGFVVKNSGTLMDFIGLGNDGNNGQMGVYGAGKIVAALQTYGGGKGQVSVFNGAGQPIAFLAESDKHAGGGNITAADPAGNGVFSAGFTGGSGGDACLNLKGKILKCLGIGLPLGVE